MKEADANSKQIISVIILLVKGRTHLFRIYGCLTAMIMISKSMNTPASPEAR